MRSNYKRIGDYIELVDERNVDLEIELLLGLSISKQFIPSVANTVGTNMKNYKIIRKGQFACSIMQVRRDGKMPIALLDEFDKAIISQAYLVFRVIDESKLLPEYLMMWFSRSEFDRLATFHAVGGVRGSLEWEDFLDFELPIPSIEQQQEIVNEYNTITNRIALNEQLNQKLEETAQALYKHWFVDFEFPDENGNPYKSSGGDMMWCYELDMEIPEGSKIFSLQELANVIDSLHKTPNYSNNGYPMVRVTDIKKGFLNVKNTLRVAQEVFEEFSGNHLPRIGNILMSRVGTYGVPTFINTNTEFCLGQNTVVIVPEIISGELLYVSLLSDEAKKQIEFGVGGAVQKTISLKTIRALKFIYPKDSINKFELSFKKIINHQSCLHNQNVELEVMTSLLLSKMTKVEVEEEIIN